VDASSSDQVWAVGSIPAGGGTRTFAQRWNGSSWSVIPTPNVPSDANVLADVTALSPSAAWAVGWWHDPSGDRTLIERWNGSSWVVVGAPAASGFGRLRAVDAVAPGDVWAVGSRGSTVLVVHYDGSSWSRFPVDDPGPSFDSLTGVAVRDADNAWTVGATNGGRDTLTMRWNGAGWTRVASPNGDTNTNNLFDVTPTAGGTAIAVGSASAIDAPLHTLAERWFNGSWNLQRTPNPGTKRNSFQGVAAIPGVGGAWAVGYREELNGSSAPLIARKSAGWKLVTAPKVASPALLRDVAAVQGAAWAVGSAGGSPLVLGVCG
jgi:hypothetical protein